MNAHTGRLPNIADQLSLHARQRATRVALIHGAKALTYRELDRAVGRRAARLQDLAVEPGSFIGLALADSMEHVLMLFAIARAGGVILPMDCRWQAFEKQRLSAHFQPAIVMVEPGGSFEGAHCIDVDDLWLAAVEGADPDRAFPDGDRGLTMSLSSGTTGRPKGPMVSHDRFVKRFWTHWVDLGFGSRETYLNATPLYFGGGRAFTMSTLYAGGTVVLLPPPYQPADLAREVARTDSSVLFLVPTLLRRLLACDAATVAPLKKLRTLVSSGSALTGTERALIRETICPNFVEYYSSTEGGGISVLSPADQLRHGESVGRPVFGVEVQVVDDAHAPVLPGQIGRIRYRGPAVADGYHLDPVASAESFKDGFFYPGDLGTFNDDGFLILKGRAKDMIIRGGINIYPQEVEALLMSHAAVQEAAVVGWPSREFNEEVAAFVTVNAAIDPAELIALCRSHLAPYKAPREVFVVDALPRNSLGKVVKADLVGRLTAR